MPGADAVLFDLDDTLCVHDQDRETLLRRTFEQVGVDAFTDQTGLRTAFHRAPDADGTAAFLANAFEIAAEQANAGPIPAGEIAHTYLDLIDPTAVSFRDGAPEALQSVADRPIGLITNGDRDHQRQKLETLGIEDAFDAVVYAGDEAPSKPSPEPFEMVLADLGVDRSGTIHVGNSLADDVAGANGVGIGSVWVPTENDGQSGAAVEPLHTLESLHQLETVL